MQLASFANALRQANLSSIGGSQVTSACLPARLLGSTSGAGQAGLPAGGRPQPCGPLLALLRWRRCQPQPWPLRPFTLTWPLHPPTPPPVLAPSNQAFTSALFSGSVTREQLSVRRTPARAGALAREQRETPLLPPSNLSQSSAPGCHLTL